MQSTLSALSPEFVSFSSPLPAEEAVATPLPPMKKVPCIVCSVQEKLNESGDASVVAEEARCSAHAASCAYCLEEATALLCDRCSNSGAATMVYDLIGTFHVEQEDTAGAWECACPNCIGQVSSFFAHRYCCSDGEESFSSVELNDSHVAVEMAGSLVNS
jgi:hypothetical protein